MPSGREREMEDYLYENPGMLEHGLVWIERTFRVDATKWLGVETRQPTDSWDTYRNHPKWIDLVGVNHAGALVLCELKYTGGAGDGAPEQVSEYYRMLLKDDDAQQRLMDGITKKVTGQTPETPMSAVSLYIVVAGKISQLFRQRLDVYRPVTRPSTLKVFQAMPPRPVTEQAQWSFEAVLL